MSDPVEAPIEAASSEPESLAERAGSGALLGVAAAAIAAVPPTLRVAGAGTSAALAWLLLATGAALPLGGLLAGLRAGAPLGKGAASAALALVVASGPLMIFASVLKASTNHRPLGAATFAIVAAGLVAGTLVAAARLVSWAGDENAKGRTIVRWVMYGLALAGTALLVKQALPVARGPGAIRTGLFDGAVALMLALVAVRFRLPGSAQRVAKLGLPIWLGLSAVGIALQTAMPSARDAVRQLAPVLLGPVGWL